MKIIRHNDDSILLIDKNKKIITAQDLLDHISDARYYNKCNAVVVYQNSLKQDFFDLKSGMAGEILQKCSTYGIKIAIIGNFEKFTSKSLKAFITESNNGNQVFFKNSLEQGLHALTDPAHP
ncbi:MAG: DUF4180 domain-containing protein [Thermotogota bacterium]